MGGVTLVALPVLAAVSVASTPGQRDKLRPSSATAPRLADVIVSYDSAADGAKVRSAVEGAGGTVWRTMPSIGSLSVEIPPSKIEKLRRIAGVRSVTPNRAVALAANLPGSSYDPSRQSGSMLQVAKATKADKYWSKGFTGSGIDVAVVDSGVSPVPGLDSKLAPGIDLTGAGSTTDGYGHGTHMAGIIAGRTSSKSPGDSGQFYGVAPDARIVPVRVADADGVTSVATVMAGIDWVISNRSSGGRNIRVLQLALAAPPMPSYVDDPLAAAAESAWHAGIVVVTAAGNSGPGAVFSPAYDPYVLAVGASDTRGTTEVNDDGVAAFSASPLDPSQRHPDLVAPGTSIQSIRVHGSRIDQLAAGTGAINDQFFKGSGTSQASAIVSGAAALVLSQSPSLRPDQVKWVLTNSARPMKNVSDLRQGEGGLRLDKVLKAVSGMSEEDDENLDGLIDDQASGGSPYMQAWARAAGSGPNAPLLTGSTWTGSTWTGSTWTASTWTGSTWTGSTWTGSTWTASTWTGSTWTGSTWTGSMWTTQGWF